MIKQEPYARPPITEVVLDLQFQTEISARDLERIRDKLKRFYPSIEPIRGLHLDIKENTTTPTFSINGFKLTSANGADIVLLNKTNIGTVRLAPYQGWDSLFKSTQTNFDLVLSVLKRPVITRIASRFINRLDIPFGNSAKITPADYSLVGVNLPQGLAKQSISETARIEFIEESEGLVVVINSGVVNPALIDHLSYLIDIDVIQQENVPLRYDDMWKRLSQFRSVKNKIFESCLTDAARALFR